MKSNSRRTVVCIASERLAALEAAEQENANLRAALYPFAHAAETFTGKPEDYIVLEEYVSPQIGTLLTVADLRHAAAACASPIPSAEAKQ